ncbi:MAG: aminopeptidase P family protein [Verrucomicrobia bacterium]|nr:aminopeptidase P family protein [Verrucomicrobiota bacterium]
MKILSNYSIDACLLEDPIDLLYLTGLTLSKGKLLIKPHETRLFVDGRYFEAAKKNSPFPVDPSEGNYFKQALQGKIGFDSAFTTYEAYQQLVKNAPDVEWVPISRPLKDLRICKNPKEIAALKRAADVTARGYTHIKTLLKEGISEEELAFEFEFFCRRHGASGLSFDSIVAFGENSAYPHHRAGKTKLKKNQVVLVDVGAVVDQYHGDMTRIAFFGEPDPKIIRLFDIVKRAQRKAVAAVRPGLRVGELDRIVREDFQKENLEEFFTHSLGHGIGLETHECLRIKWNNEDADLILRPGMVFTIEPGLYQPGLGGIRYEDMILVTETGHENFFQNLE